MRETHTPVRNLRVPDDLWRAAKDKAAREGKTVTEVLIAALRRYVAR
jgi:predicted HicB family RNase H-like nuclease